MAPETGQFIPPGPHAAVERVKRSELAAPKDVSAHVFPSRKSQIAISQATSPSMFTSNSDRESFNNFSEKTLVFEHVDTEVFEELRRVVEESLPHRQLKLEISLSHNPENGVYQLNNRCHTSATISVQVLMLSEIPFNEKRSGPCSLVRGHPNVGQVIRITKTTADKKESTAAYIPHCEIGTALHHLLSVGRSSETASSHRRCQLVPREKTSSRDKSDVVDELKLEHGIELREQGISDRRCSDVLSCLVQEESISGVNALILLGALAIVMVSRGDEFRKEC
ncbi:hypothetical protein EDD17DRAFT_1897446 [Pisolithus thermaeus]|nr:hypothetical protein EDD17DRAFT_1897446 [Pisolithus thermaeus]